MWSSSLPGVATTISTPAFNKAVCLSIEVPPWTRSVRSDVYFEKFSNASALWAASSRVGLNTRTLGPPCSCAFASFITGNANAAVLPVPVCAVAIKSEPFSISGIAEL